MSYYAEALSRFEQLWQRAMALDLREPTAVILATATPSGLPSARVVLLRGHDERGFVFYTNSRSLKGRQLAANPHGALCFYWDPLQEQVRVEGEVQIVSEEESDHYWQRRSRMSQLASMASRQSETLVDYAEYEAEVNRLEHEFSERDVPRPAHWIGYRVIPRRIEFWIGQQARMHERTVYELHEGEWQRFLLYP